MGWKYRVASHTAGILGTALGAVGKNFQSEVAKQISLPSVRASDMEIVCPALVEPTAEDINIADRVLKAYDLAKEAQANAPSVFQPSLLWQKLVDKAYCDLAKNTPVAAKFLANFGAWPEYTGIENSVMLRDLNASSGGRRNLRAMMSTQIEWWHRHESNGRPLGALTYPRHGNQYGVRVKGTFIGLGSVFNDVHSSAIRLLCEEPRPIIADIGGGYGKLMYFLSKKLSEFCYVNFDLPETLACAAYYTLKAYPGKKVLLFGEGKLDGQALLENDFILFPSFAIQHLPTQSVDVFLNKNSLGEMKPETTKLFASEISRTTAGWFWHMNHEFFRNKYDENASMINGEYMLPKDEFQFVSRYQDIGHAIYEGGYNAHSDIYVNMFRRK